MIRLLVYVEWLVIRLAVKPVFFRLQIKRGVEKVGLDGIGVG